MSLKQLILEKIKSHRTVSFAELTHFEGFSGDYCMCLGRDENMVLWPSLSEEAASAMTELWNDGEIHPVPTTSLVYLMDGVALSLPVAKSARKYKRPHWVPVVWNPGRHPKHDKWGKK
jgi:hypothetical protein